MRLGEDVPVLVPTDVHPGPVVEPCAPQVLVVDSETQRFYQVKRVVGRGAESRDRACIRGNLGLHENDVHDTRTGRLATGDDQGSG